MSRAARPTTFDVKKPASVMSTTVKTKPTPGMPTGTQWSMVATTTKAT